MRVPMQSKKYVFVIAKMELPHPKIRLSIPERRSVFLQMPF